MYVMSPTPPSGPMSMPSYRSWARRIVRLEPKPSFFAPSRCSVLVVNGGAGFLRRSRRFTSVTGKAPTKSARAVPRPRRRDSRRHPLHFRHHHLRVGVLADLRLLPVDVVKLGREALTFLVHLRFDGPVLDRLERADLALALDDQS